MLKYHVSKSWIYKSFGDLYQLKDEVLGRGAHATVQTCVDRHTGEECALKIIHKTADSERVFNEIDLFYRVQDHPQHYQAYNALRGGRPVAPDFR